MLVSQQELKAGNPHPEPGEKVALEAQDENGHVLYRQIYTLAQSKAEAPGLALEATMVEEEWLDAEFKRGQTEPPLEGAGAKEGIDALKLAWDIIKDNRAVTDLKGASSALLNPDDMNPFNYAGGREGSSPQVYWWGYNWPIKSWKCFEIWLRVCGVYRAKGPESVRPGVYIPSLYVDFPKSPWAGFGLTMNASASVMHPWNAGSATNVVAQCDIVTSVTVSSFVDPSRPQQFKFAANGASGFRRK